MDQLALRLRVARKALRSLRAILKSRKSIVARDAAIQRFEYTFEAVWKTVKVYLLARQGLDLASPKSVLRAAGASGLLNEVLTRRALTMTDDRNRTSHTYNQQVAVQIYKRIPKYADLMEGLLSAMERPSQTMLQLKE